MCSIAYASVQRRPDRAKHSRWWAERRLLEGHVGFLILSSYRRLEQKRGEGLGPPTLHGESHTCSEDDRKQDRDGRVLEKSPRQGKRRDIVCH